VRTAARRRDTAKKVSPSGKAASLLLVNGQQTVFGKGIPMKLESCPTCGKRRTHWRENNGRGCCDADVTYCSQRCAGVFERFKPDSAA
jgi:hypothetical protein